MRRVHCGDGEAKFWLEPHIELANNCRVSRSRIKEVEQIIEDATMKSSALGTNTSPAEVTHISKHGVWLWRAAARVLCLTKISRGSGCARGKNPER